MKKKDNNRTLKLLALLIARQLKLRSRVDLSLGR